MMPRTHPSRRASLKTLTARQRAVLDLIAAGQTGKEIAARLGLSFHTVRAHTEQIFSRLGVHTRAAATAVRLGATPSRASAHPAASTPPSAARRAP